MKPTFKNRPNQVHIVDGKEIWISRSVAVVACVTIYYNKEFYILAEKRSAKMDKAGMWSLPCGYLDYDESGTEAVLREVYEETGLYLPEYGEFEYFNSLHTPFRINTEPTDHRQNISLCYGIDFEMDIPEIKGFNKEECDEVKFIKVSDIKKYNWAFGHDNVINLWLSFIEANS